MSEYAIAPSALNLGVFTQRESSDLTPAQWLSDQQSKSSVNGLILAAHLPYDLVGGDDVWLSRANWNEHQRGLVVFVAVPRGGGKGGSNPLMLVASLALAAFAPWAAGALLGTTSGLAFSAVAAGIGIVGQSLISKAFGSSASPTNASLPAASPTYSNQVRGNQARLNESIPVQYGEVMFPPEFIQQPYVDFDGDDEYLNCLYCLGHGAFIVDEAGFGLGLDLPLGELDGLTLELISDNYLSGRDSSYYPVSAFGTALASLGQVSQSVSILSGCSYVAADVSNYSIDDTDWTRWFMPVPRFAGANELMFNLIVPGLYYAEDNGNLSVRTITFSFQAQRIDNEGNDVDSVIDLDGYVITAGTVETLRRTHSVNVSRGRWKVRCMRTEAVSTNQRLNNKSLIHSVVSHDNSVELPGYCTYLAMRIKATGQLSGSIDNQFYVNARRKLAKLDNAELLNVNPNQSTYNYPKIAVADMLRSYYGLNAGGAVDSEAHLAYLPALTEYSVMESANAYPARSRFNFRFDSATPLMDAISMAMKPYMATPYIMGGRIYFAMAKKLDQSAQKVAEGVESYTESVTMPRSLQSSAVDVEYWDERYSRLTTVQCRVSGDTPKLVDKLNLYGINDANDAYTQGMKYLISAKVQTHDITYETDIRGRVPMPMDRVELLFVDEMEAQTGYITAITQDAGFIKLQLSDDPLIDYSASGVAARMTIRTASGQSLRYNIMGGDEPDAICEAWISTAETYAYLLLNLTDECFGQSGNALQYAITANNGDDDLTQYKGQGTVARVLSIEPGSDGKVKVNAIKDTPLLYQNLGYAHESINPHKLSSFYIYKITTTPLATVMPVPMPTSSAMTIRLSWPHQNGADVYECSVLVDGEWAYADSVSANECWFNTELLVDAQGNQIDLSDIRFSVRGAKVFFFLGSVNRYYGYRAARSFNLLDV